MLAVVVLALLPSIARAGDSPIFVVDNWGVGEIDGRIMLYLGKDRYLDTPLHSSPKRMACDLAICGAVIGGCVAAWRYRRRYNETLQRTAAAGRAFDVQKVSESGPGR